jgi:hypothetical protein
MRMAARCCSGGFTAEVIQPDGSVEAVHNLSTKAGAADWWPSDWANREPDIRRSLDADGTAPYVNSGNPEIGHSFSLPIATEAHSDEIQELARQQR